ncbi:MAG TPA: preprotein translocase subunit SecA [Tissierellia bacterium]|nr:preprotein translocase subunit SecA [Tissierellia bacterium]
MGILNFFRERINKGELKKLEDIADQIEGLEQSIQALSDAELRSKTDEFKQRIADGESLDDLLPEAFAVVREAAIRTIGQRPYRVQLIGGIVLHQGRITEMKTGEGKTLVATMPLYLNALSGKGAHLITVNDYLAHMQGRWMGKIYEFLGLSVGILTNDVKGPERKDQYLADITYGTNNEFGFDYLRDNMVTYKEQRVQRPLHYAIVDEVDSILIDEARTPLIISGRGRQTVDYYSSANRFANSLSEDDVIIDEKQKTIVLTDETGIPQAEAFFGIENLADSENMEISHRINQAIRARWLMKRDIDYVVRDGEVLIVDEFTGRLMEGRRYSNGLHQAIEAKEGIEVKNETQTLATITLQNFFRMYDKLGGMTGTAKTEEEEFREIYNMDVVEIPTNMPVVREDLPDVVYSKMEFKFKAIIEEIIRRHETGQPLLVGTISIEVSELLSQMLRRRGIKHEVLNAKQHAKEAEIVAQAGRFGAVTIATNMAGRGTDIMLGGNVEFLIKKELRKLGYEEDIIDKAWSPLDYDEPEVIEAKAKIEEIRGPIEAEVAEEAERVRAVGGLHVLGTERHEARRIDLQLRGRSGRQGDPGSSQFYLSLQDDLLRIFMKEGIAEQMMRLGMDENVPLQHKILTNQIESAQKKVEGNHYGTRRYVLQYDQVMNEQRKYIYSERNRVLENDNLREHILNMTDSLIEGAVEQYTAGSRYFEDWNIEGLTRYLQTLFLKTDPFEGIDEITKDDLIEQLQSLAHEAYDEKEAEIGDEQMRELERFVLLHTVDNHWIEHIDAMDQLKQGIGLRAIGQIDPVRAYQTEGFDMYEEMIQSITEETVRYMYNAKIQKEPIKREAVAEITDEAGPGAPVRQSVRTEAKIGRNDPCPCGSGKKYKHCHGRN